VSSFSSLRSLADLPRCYARGKEGVNQRTVGREKEKICAVMISARRNATHTECTAANGKRLDCLGWRGNEYCYRRCYRPLTTTPKSAGWSADVSQRQLPLSVFWNANAFSILNLRATEKASLLPGGGFSPPGLKSQHIPVQLEAIGPDV
jgi:hypothetical protein